MSYTIKVYPEVQVAIANLPPAGRHALAELYTVLELTPWVGPSVNPVVNPDGELRNLPFGPDGAGLLTYLILERDDEVHLVSLLWAMW